MPGMQARPLLPVGALHTKGGHIVGFAISNVAVAELARVAERINRPFEAGLLSARSVEALPLARVARAHALLENGEGRGTGRRCAPEPTPAEKNMLGSYTHVHDVVPTLRYGRSTNSWFNRIEIPRISAVTWDDVKRVGFSSGVPRIVVKRAGDRNSACDMSR